MSRKELIELGCVALILIVLFSPLFYLVYKKDERHAAYCEARGMKVASHYNQQGKTSVSSHFCVDDQGRVYWITE